MDRPGGADKKIVILDACQTVAKGAPGIIEAKGLAILLSCSPGQKSREYEEKGLSVFTYFLLEKLANGRVTIEAVAKEVKQKVYDWGKQEKQIPTLEPDEHNEAVKRIPLSYHSHQALHHALLALQHESCFASPDEGNQYRDKLGELVNQQLEKRQWIAEAMLYVQTCSDNVRRRLAQLLEPTAKGFEPIPGYSANSSSYTALAKCDFCRDEHYVFISVHDIKPKCNKCKRGKMIKL